MTHVVLFSGGLDSTTALTDLVRTGRRPIVAVSVIYGQLHKVEIEAAREICKHFEIPHEVITLPASIMAGSSSALIPGGVSMPEMTYQELTEEKGVSPTYVPNRNALLISTAVARCLIHGGGEVTIGAHAEDARNFAYPDCTPDFMAAMKQAVWVGSGYQVSLSVPFQFMTKYDIVAQGLAQDAPYGLTVSCYKGVPACGKCPTCVERLNAFKVNNAQDPIPYREAV